MAETDTRNGHASERGCAYPDGDTECDPNLCPPECFAQVVMMLTTQEAEDLSLMVRFYKQETHWSTEAGRRWDDINRRHALAERIIEAVETP